MTESQILHEVLCAVTAIPEAMFFRQNVGVAMTVRGNVVRFAVPGAPDIQGVYKGKAVGIEVKTATGRQSDQQKRFQAAWERAGGVYILARSKTEALMRLSLCSD